jgi:outer membrane biosynthesis protein TonB
LTASIGAMDSPRSGFRRATAASWALVGLGVAGVAGTSALAYADTVKPPAAQAPVVAIEQAAPQPDPAPVLDVPPPPDVVTTTAEPPPPPPPPPTVTDSPPASETPVQQQQITTRQQQIVPQQIVEQAPAPTTHQAPAPTTTRRRNLTPTTVMAPNFSPHVTVSHGS